MTTDTRAALDAAILKYGGDAATSYEFHARPPDDRDLNAAITAHVEAEVARRIAAAPSVESALAAYGTAVYELGYVLHRPDRDAVLRPIKDAAEATLRAAIAADRERAVREAAEPPRITSTTGVVPVVADADGRMLGGRREGRDTVYDQIKVPVARDKARPTPDEARRLVDAHGDSIRRVERAAARRVSDAAGEPVTEQMVTAQIDTRAALLRALGVEA